MSNEMVIKNGILLNKDGLVSLKRNGSNQLVFVDADVPLGVSLSALVGGGGAAALPDLTDVNVALAPADGHILFYNSGGPYWDSKILDGTPNTSFTLNSDDGAGGGILYGGATSKLLTLAASQNTYSVSGGHIVLNPTASGLSLENWLSSAWTGRARLYNTGGFDLFDIELKNGISNALFRFNDNGDITVQPYIGGGTAIMSFAVGGAGNYTYTFPAVTGNVPISVGSPNMNDILQWNGTNWVPVAPSGATAQDLESVLAEGADAYQKSLTIHETASPGGQIAFKFDYTGKQLVLGSVGQAYEFNLYGDLVLHSDIKGINQLWFPDGLFNVKVQGPAGLTQDYVITLPADTSTLATVDNLGDYLPKTGGTITGSLTITGDLAVNGTTTTVNTTNLEVKDKNILLNKGGGVGSAPGAGFQVEENSAVAQQFSYNAGGYWEIGAPASLKKVAIQSGAGSYDLNDYLKLTGGTLTGAINMSSNAITGVTQLNAHTVPAGSSTLVLASNNMSILNDVQYTTGPAAGQILVYNALGYWEPKNTSTVGDNLGNHTATQLLNMATFGISNVSAIAMSAPSTINSHVVPAAAPSASVFVLQRDNMSALADVNYATPNNDDVLIYSGGQWINTPKANVGDNLGNHTATMALDMAANNITNCGTINGHSIPALTPSSFALLSNSINDFSDVNYGGAPNVGDILSWNVGGYWEAIAFPTPAGDNLGDHTATTTLDMDSNAISNVTTINGNTMPTGASTIALLTDIPAGAPFLSLAGGTMAGTINMSLQSIDNIAQAEFQNGANSGTISVDGSGNLSFNDSVTGTKTLAQLAAVGGGTPTLLQVLVAGSTANNNITITNASARTLFAVSVGAGVAQIGNSTDNNTDTAIYGNLTVSKDIRILSGANTGSIKTSVLSGSRDWTFPNFTGTVAVYATGSETLNDVLTWNGTNWTASAPSGGGGDLDVTLGLGVNAYQKDLVIHDNASPGGNIAFKVDYTGKQVIVGSGAQNYDLELYGDLNLHSDITGVTNIDISTSLTLGTLASTNVMTPGSTVYPFLGTLNYINNTLPSTWKQNADMPEATAGSFLSGPTGTYPVSGFFMWDQAQTAILGQFNCVEKRPFGIYEFKNGTSEIVLDDIADYRAFWTETGGGDNFDVTGASQAGNNTSYTVTGTPYIDGNGRTVLPVNAVPVDEGPDSTAETGPFRFTQFQMGAVGQGMVFQLVGDTDLAFKVISDGGQQEVGIGVGMNLRFGTSTNVYIKNNEGTPNNELVFRDDLSGGEVTLASLMGGGGWAPAKYIYAGQTGNFIADSFADTSASGVVWHYSVYRTDNPNEAARTGTISAAWLQSGSLNYNQITTVSVGDSSAAVLTAQNNAGTIQLDVAISGGTWDVKIIRNDM